MGASLTHSKQRKDKIELVTNAGVKLKSISFTEYVLWNTQPKSRQGWETWYYSLPVFEAGAFIFVVGGWWWGFDLWSRFKWEKWFVTPKCTRRHNTYKYRQLYIKEHKWVIGVLNTHNFASTTKILSKSRCTHTYIYLDVDNSFVIYDIKVFQISSIALLFITRLRMNEVYFLPKQC